MDTIPLSVQKFFIYLVFIFTQFNCSTNIDFEIEHEMLSKTTLMSNKEVRITKKNTNLTG